MSSAVVDFLIAIYPKTNKNNKMQKPELSDQLKELINQFQLSFSVPANQIMEEQANDFVCGECNPLVKPPEGYRCVPCGKPDMGYLSRIIPDIEFDGIPEFKTVLDSVNFAQIDNQNAELLKALLSLSNLDLKIAAKVKELEDLRLIIKTFSEKCFKELSKLS